jgi:hypothetical protein
MKNKKIKWQKPTIRDLGSCATNGSATCYKGCDNFPDCRNGNKDLSGCSQGHKFINEETP